MRVPSPRVGFLVRGSNFEWGVDESKYWLA